MDCHTLVPKDTLRGGPSTATIVAGGGWYFPTQGGVLDRCAESRRRRRDVSTGHPERPSHLARHRADAGTQVAARSTLVTRHPQGFERLRGRSVLKQQHTSEPQLRRQNGL